MYPYGAATSKHSVRSTWHTFFIITSSQAATGGRPLAPTPHFGDTSASDKVHKGRERGEEGRKSRYLLWLDTDFVI